MGVGLGTCGVFYSYEAKKIPSRQRVFRIQIANLSSLCECDRLLKPARTVHGEQESYRYSGIRSQKVI